MCIIGNQKAQEAKNEVIHNHKQLTVWHVLLGLICVFSQLSIHFYVIKTVHLCIMLFHTLWIFKDELGDWVWRKHTIVFKMDN